MLPQRSAQDEGSGAQRAAVGSLARVEAPVSPQGSPVLEDLITKAANVELADGSLQYLRPPGDAQSRVLKEHRADQCPPASVKGQSLLMMLCL